MKQTTHCQISHYSQLPVAAVRSAVQRKKPDYKPYGLWLSIDGTDDWLEWCMSNEFRLEGLALKYRVVLNAAANILQLSSEKELAEFTTAFDAPQFPELGERCESLRGINWRAVAERYQGIIIAPYIGQMRLTLHWYYTWDCASGCVWDAAAVDSIELMQGWKMPEKEVTEEELCH